MSYTVDDLLEGLTIDLGYDAVGLWQVHQYGAELLNLSGDELDGFLRVAVSHLLENGAVPLRAHKGGWWLRQHHLGSERDAIAESVLKDWNDAGRTAPGVDGVWFGRTDVLDVQ